MLQGYTYFDISNISIGQLILAEIIQLMKLLNLMVESDVISDNGDIITGLSNTFSYDFRIIPS